MGQVYTMSDLHSQRNRWKQEGKSVVFTNGVFDILHRGHVDYLAKAKALGDILIVGLNSDASVRRIKGELRPIVRQEDRAFVLAGLASVDAVCLFEEDTPFNIISTIVPDTLVKGADYTLDTIVGRDVVESAGGSVRTIEFVPDRSTTSIVDTILHRFGKK
ncbi:MAG: D-glycero-beta-D-manno-heptose 1-phosphate adenylyltransferase [Bacteroidetes bacterium]|nr:D-glycero-beta-D-manno-heptose 1-phosphate adenylyltransferase [Bacteroidota bacterium]